MQDFKLNIDAANTQEFIPYLVRSRRSWGTAQCEDGQSLNSKVSHGPTSRASPQIES